VGVGAGVDAALAEIELEDCEGGRRRLGELWRDRAAVLVFVRHFG
jgi:hypothetical protein